MANDSSTGGYLQTTSPPLVEDAALEVILQNLVVGITGFLPTRVRPRWQEVSPTELEVMDSWCAIGVTDEQPEEGNVSSTFGDETLRTVERVTINVLASFYGPDCRAMAQNFRSGIMVPQNREALYFADISLAEWPGAITFAPAFVSERVRRRADVPFKLRRAITMEWPIKSLVTAVIQTSALRPGGEVLSNSVVTPSSLDPLTE